jgi:hypothetical protein
MPTSITHNAPLGEPNGAQTSLLYALKPRFYSGIETRKKRGA